jgi:hypothetical protein
MPTNIPLDGRLPSQNPFPGTVFSFTGTEMLYIVSPGNNTQGQSYNITTGLLAQYFSAFPSLNPTFIKTAEAYNSQATDTRILLQLSPAGVVTITMLASASYAQPILIKDVAGNLSNTNTTTISFSSGQSADGLTSIVMQTPYEGIWLNPLSTGGFYITQA